MIPVILIHEGYQDYVNYTIKQANKNNFVYFIGNVNPNLNLNNFEFIDIKNYLGSYEEFSKNYTHLSTNSFGYELFCYNRWFVLRKFMEEKKLNVVFYIDSDVMLFVNVNDEWDKYNQYDMTLLHRTAAVSSFITYKGINNLCILMEHVYKNKNSYEFKKIESHYRVRNECGLPGGVCDMTLLDFFHYTDDFNGGPGRIGEMMQIINDSTYDHNINVPDQDFAFKRGIKDIQIINKIPYVYNEKLKKNIKFNSLHFQGGAKNLINLVYGQCN